MCLPVCHHGVANQSVSARLSVWVGGVGGTISRASRGLGVQSIPDNPETALTAIKPALLLK